MMTSKKRTARRKSAKSKSKKGNLVVTFKVAPSALRRIQRSQAVTRDLQPNNSHPETAPAILEDTTSPRFPSFPKLPPELRCAIWRLAALTWPSRIVDFTGISNQHTHNIKFYSRTPHHPLIVTSHEAGTESCKVLKWIKGNNFMYPIQPFVFNFDQDILFLGKKFQEVDSQIGIRVLISLFSNIEMRSIKRVAVQIPEGWNSNLRPFCARLKSIKECMITPDDFFDLDGGRRWGLSRWNKPCSAYYLDCEANTELYFRMIRERSNCVWGRQRRPRFSIVRAPEEGCTCGARIEQ